MIAALGKRLLELVQETDEEQHYSLSIDEERNRIILLNDSTVCIEITLDEKTLELNILSHCGVPQGGTKHLSSILELGKEFPIDKITLQDASHLTYQFPERTIELNLRHLSILRTGLSWYGKYGFHDQDTIRFGEKIMECIELPLSQHLETYASDNPRLIKRIQNKLEELELDESNSIKEIMEYLYESMKEMCPERVCTDDALDFIVDVKRLIALLFKLVMIYITPKDIGQQVEKQMRSVRKPKPAAFTRNSRSIIQYDDERRRSRSPRGRR